MRALAAAISVLIFITAFPSPTISQSVGKVYRIGFLTPSKRALVTFRAKMREIGYVEGKNLIIDFRHAKSTKEFITSAKELARLDVDLILAIGAGATRAAKEVTTTIPIVMGNASIDPVREGLIDSLSRPGGNITGVIDLFEDLAGKQVELLKSIFPNLSRVAHLSPEGNVGTAHQKATVAAAQSLGLKVYSLQVHNPDDLESAFQSVSDSGAEALVVVGTSFFIPNAQRIIDLEMKHQLPGIHNFEWWVRLGGLISYTTDRSQRYLRAAKYVDMILRGAKPADLPVEQVSSFRLDINLKTAEKLGISIPPEILLRATNIVE